MELFGNIYLARINIVCNKKVLFERNKRLYIGRHRLFQFTIISVPVNIFLSNKNGLLN